MSPPVQELPNPYKPVRFRCLPLTRSARRGRRALRAVFRSPSVGRDHWARRVQELPTAYKPVCPYRQIATGALRPRNDTTATPSAAARNGWGMPHPYKYLSRIVCGAGACPRRGTIKSVQTRSSVPSAASRSARRGRRALRAVLRSPSVGRDHWARRVQELPNPYKPVRPYRPPLTRNGWGMPHPYSRLSQPLCSARHP